MIKKLEENGAIVLCSGGLDSVVTANYVKKKLGYNKIIVLFFDYGQKTLFMERKCSKMCAKDIGAEFNEIRIKELGGLSTSFINKNGKNKNGKDLKDTKKESEQWYVPSRNLVFLSYALSLAESRFVKHGRKYDLFVGFKNEGKESYPDTTQEFLDKLNSVSRISCKYPVEIKAPLIKMDKEDIVLLGDKLGIDFRKTWSCYIGLKRHCGTCLNCRLRRAGFYWAGIEDVSSYSG